MNIPRIVRSVIATALVTASAALAVFPGAAQEQTRESLSVGAWEVSVAQGTEGPPVCIASQTLLAEPGRGGAGGRVTWLFRYSVSGFQALLTITGGADERPGVEVWVNNRRMVSGVPEAGRLNFSQGQEATLLSMFRAGHRSSVHFSRGGRPVEVTFSLAGFTGATRTAASRCGA